MSKTIAIVGAGHVGQSIGRALRRRGYAVGVVVTRSTRTARRAVEFIGAGKPRPNLSVEIMRAGVVLVATPDGEVAKVARALTGVGGSWRGKIVLHTSGALTAHALTPLQKRGASVGSLHPIYPFPQPLRRFPRGVVFGIDGSRKAQREARRWVQALRGNPIAIRPRSRPLYHASAALVAGHLMTLIDLGTRMLHRAGVPARQARSALLPLVESTLAGYARLGERAWTGPLQRGDVATVRDHLASLRKLPRAYQDVYVALARAAVELYKPERSPTSRRLRRLLGRRK